ncbi:SRPBCC family protein [Marisediminicola senii]|uniref:SRPBCC family protein n=1 Tax=Marisediminicola senii TaxID=2711233 RepID=UPI0013ECCC96|nr:SRPBCC domain-containing protein [Marisediminicola senii]
MTVVSTVKDPNALTLTFVTEFDAAVDQVWQLWKDPRQLERWWGPPTYPATFDSHDFTVGGRSLYYMTSPEGEKMWGWWETTAIEELLRYEFDDGFANDDGSKNTDIDSTHGVVTLEAVGDKTRMTIVSFFTSQKQLDEMVEMGMEEGMREALGQIDSILTSVSA